MIQANRTPQQAFEELFNVLERGVKKINLDVSFQVGRVEAVATTLLLKEKHQIAIPVGFFKEYESEVSVVRRSGG